MSTKDFVESTGRDRYWRQVAKELAMIQDERGMLKPELHHHVNCAVCNIDDATPVFVKEGFTFVKCNKCGLLYVNPQCETGKLNEYYDCGASADIWVEVLLSNTEIDYDVNKFTKCCEDMERLITGRRVLDVGCSVGIFLDVARKRGWHTTGLELNNRAYEYAKNTLGLDIHKKLLDECGFAPGQFDAITLWEVLEHIPDPRGIIEQIAALLTPGGLLSILVPNRNALSARMLRQDCACFGGRNHLWYFDPDTLTELLRQSGFAVESVSTQLSQMEEMLTYLNYRNPYHERRSDSDFSIDGDLRAKIEKFIFDNNLGYKLLVHAIKV